MNTHMIELGLGAMKVFQICTSRLGWRDSFEVAADGVGGDRFLSESFEGEIKHLTAFLVVI